MADSPVALEIARLVVDHHADVYRYAYRLAGSAADAEDLTQQTFLAAQVKLAQLRSSETARPWLFTILRNCYLKVRRRSVPLSAGSSGRRSRALQAALDALPDEFKLVLLMFYFEECSYREIAERLGMPIGTVMSRLSRAKRQLRGRLFELELQSAGTRAAAAVHTTLSGETH